MNDNKTNNTKTRGHTERHRITEPKWNYAEDISRITDNKSNERIKRWRQWTEKRRRGMPIIIWHDNLNKRVEFVWLKTVQTKRYRRSWVRSMFSFIYKRAERLKTRKNCWGKKLSINKKEKQFSKSW